MLPSILIGTLIGAASELVAYRQRLWVYRRPIYPILNVLLMFGFVMGSLASLGGGLGLAALFAIGFGVGLAYELLNFAVLDWWFFPGDRLYGLSGREACALGISVAWGGVPVAVALARGLA